MTAGRAARLLAGAVLCSALVALSAIGGAAARPAADRRVAPRFNTFTKALWVADIGRNVEYSSPTFATIEGVRAIVAASLSGYVYVVNARTGRELPGWPQPAIITGRTPTAIDSSPTVAYLDGPGKGPTIIVGAGSKAVPNQNGGVIAFYENGRVRFVFHTLPIHQTGVDSPYDDEVFASPAVGDIQGNGEQDIVFGGFDHRIYALTPSGALVHGFPIIRDDATWASALLVDSTHTGKDDIIVGSAASGFKAKDGRRCYGGWMLDYRYSAWLREPYLVWSDCLGESVWSSATAGVINPGPANPGNIPAIVVGTSFDHEIPGQIDTADELLAFYANTGRMVPGWPVITPHPPGTTGATFASPVITQVEPGGPPVVISVSCACVTGPAVLSEWTGTGRRLWTTDYNPHHEGIESPIVANVTGQGPNDIIVGDSPGMYILSAANGAPVDITNAYPLQDGCRVLGSAAISPVQGVSSGYELVFTCERPSLTQAVMAAYPLPAPPDQIGFTEWRANAAHNGIPDPPTGGKLNCGPPAHDAAYRLVRADGRILTFGSLPNCGGLSTLVLPSPVVGLASVPGGDGYYVALQDGKVYGFGKALWHGDGLGAIWRGPSVPPGAPMVGIAAVRDGDGYYLLDGEGHVYAFGSARYFGSPGAMRGTAVAIVTNPAGPGYWVVTSTANVYGFGGAAALRSISGPTAIVGAAATPDGKGLWLLSSNGWVHVTGDATFRGEPRRSPASPMVGIAPSPNGKGYWMVESNGTVDAFPSPGLENFGSASRPSEPIVAIASPIDS